MTQRNATAAIVGAGDFIGAAIARELALPVQIGENFDGPKDMADALAADRPDDDEDEPGLDRHPAPQHEL